MSAGNVGDSVNAMAMFADKQAKALKDPGEKYSSRTLFQLR